MLVMCGWLGKAAGGVEDSSNARRGTRSENQGTAQAAADFMVQVVSGTAQKSRFARFYLRRWGKGDGYNRLDIKSRVDGQLLEVADTRGPGRLRQGQRIAESIRSPTRRDWNSAH